MPQTLTVVTSRADALSTDIEAARVRLAEAVDAGLLADGQVHAAGSPVLVLSHDRGENDADVHRAAWDALVAAGADLLAEEFGGSLHGAGAGVAEVPLAERPDESLVVFAAAHTGVGAFNLPLLRAFADPFSTSGLVLAEAMHAGFAFEMHDLQQRRKVMFTAPEELHDLLAFAGSSSRFAVKRVVARGTGEVAAAASTDRAAEAGGASGADAPCAVVRCGGAFPTVAEALAPFLTPHLVEGALRGSHVGPWAPLGLEAARAAGGLDAPSVTALGVRLTAGRLSTPRDLFAEPAFDRARREAHEVADYLRRHGPAEPHRAPLDEVERATLPAVARTADRWSAL